MNDRARTAGAGQPAPVWSNPDLGPDQFLYGRAGPWPQPAPAYPTKQAPEVLNLPAEEMLVWNQAIGARYLDAKLNWAGDAAALAAKDLGQPVPIDEEFARFMTQTVYARFLREESGYWIADFSAMNLLLDPLPGTFCAAVICRFKRESFEKFTCVDIKFPKTGVTVTKADKAWNLAKVYACQGAAYYALFVSHTALHFPMDSVNAITKTAVPHIHPLYQAIYPHTAYTLTLDNAVQESPNSVVASYAPATWFDPVTANGYDVKQLFGVGYSGYGEHYPAYDYMQPWMNPATLFGGALQIYFEPFLGFAGAVASVIPPTDPYVLCWADYCSQNIRRFPGKSVIFSESKNYKGYSNLAVALAIYLWDVTVAHGADHYSFAYEMELRDKFLRIRRPAPLHKDDGHDVKLVGDVCTGDDLASAHLAKRMFFDSWTIPPSLIDTKYLFTEPLLQAAADTFQTGLRQVSSKVAALYAPYQKQGLKFMPLQPEDETPPAPYALTIPASIQY